MNRRIPALTSLAALLLSGCAVNTVGQADRRVTSQTHDAAHYIDEARQPLPPADMSPVQVVDGVFGSAVARRSDHGSPLPRKLEQQGVTIVNAEPIEIFEIGSVITEVTGIPVSFAPDVYAAGPGEQASASSGGAATLPGAAQPPRPSDISAMLGQMGLAGGNSANSDGQFIRAVTGSRSKMLVNYHGKLSSFLDQVGSHFSATWEYTGADIRFFRNVTRTFTVHALPLNGLTMNSTLDASSSASASGGAGTSTAATTGGSSQKASSDVQLKIWDDLNKAVTSIVGSGGQVATSVSTGTISVTAPPETVNRVQAFIDGQNARLDKQVTVNVEILNLSLTDSDNYQLDVQGLFNQASKYGLTFGNTAGQAASAVLTSATPSAGFNIASGNGKLSGTNAIMQALAEHGRVSVVNTSSVTTLNGIPAPFQVTNLRGYLQSVQTTNSGGTTSSSSNTQTTLTPGSVTTGYNLSVLPRVADNGRSLMMQVGINVSELNGANNGFDTFSTGGQMIQLPNVNSRNFVQAAEVPTGATLVITGYSQASESSSRQGMGSPNFMLLGGNAVGSRSRNLIVILVTPTVLSQQAISSN
jgi:type IVB pilus formation R64 PilN family outer membrane protein